MKPLVMSWDKPPRKKRERTVPVCACCGRTLPKADGDNLQLARDSRRKSKDRERGLAEGVEPMTADGMPPTRGPYGDNLVCSQVCGHVLAVRLMIALGTDVLKLLPEPWRYR